MTVVKRGFAEFSRDLDAADRGITKKVGRVTGMALNKMKKDAQARVRGYPHLPHLPRAFTYDVRERRDSVLGEVGAEHDRPQGKLDVYIEFGSPTSQPIPHWAPAAAREVPAWERYLDEVAAEDLE